MTEMSDSPEPPHRFSHREFAVALAVIEDAVLGTGTEENTLTWQTCLRALHASEGGDLSNGVLTYLSTLSSDEQRLGFVSGIQVGLLMARIG